MRQLIIVLLLFCSFNVSSQTFTLKDTLFSEGDMLRTYQVQFVFDKAIIQEVSKPFLDSLVSFLNVNEAVEIEILNHLEPRNSEAYGTCLSCKRAKSICDYLIDKGIDKQRLSPKGMGESRPLVSTRESHEQQAKNRRTEFVITKAKEEECVLYIPSSFPASGDSFNECVQVQYSCPLDSFELVIFNRWGELIFESTPEVNCWDGTYKGKAVPTEVYVWRVTLYRSEGKEEHLGNITLIR